MRQNTATATKKSLFCLQRICDIFYKRRMQIVRSIIVLVGLVSLAAAQIPSGCECPLDCVCSTSSGTIDCSSADLRFVPVELNSCEWPGISVIDLSGNFIGTVHNYAFSQLLNVTRLYLDGNQIAQIDNNAFVGLESLEVLFLDGNRITTLSHRVFRSLRKLKKLLLYSNLLTTLPYGIFSEQRELTQLALYDNQIERLRTEVFDDVPALEELYLHENLVSDLSNAPFRSLVRLRTLYLNDNRLSQISRFSFLGLARLGLLILSGNTISNIESDTFNPTQRLQYLYLESNRLTNINRLMFAGPAQLLILQLYDNEITRISDGAFYRLNKLEKLSLHSNHITNVGKQTFVGMDSLQELVLYNNRLTNLTQESFAQLSNLRRLWLYDNSIACIEPDTFKGLQSLQTLQLSSNRISYLPDELFLYSPNLLYLFLYDNDMTTIGNTPFKNLPNLIQLSLYSNPIEYMAAGALEGSNNLYYLQWSDFGGNNHLVCDCGTLWLYEWMKARPLQSSVVCAQPEQHNGVDIRALQRSSFGCSGAVLSVEVGPNCDNHIVQLGGCLRLTCSSSPRGPVVWSRLDGHPIRQKPNTCSGNSAPSLCTQGGGGDGVLLVEGVEAEDGGYYLCTAEFRNVTRSQICQVIIGEAPTVDTPPADVFQASPGPAVTFPLAFSGTPQPSVKWYQVSSDGSQLLLEEQGLQSRYYISKQGTLVILQSVKEDEGVYRAVISNGAGETSVEAELSFYSENSCHKDCLNGGRCVQLSTCSCRENFVGRECEQYIGPVIDVTEEPAKPTQALPTTSTKAQATTPTTDYTTTSSGEGSGDYIDETDGFIDDEDYGIDTTDTSPYDEELGSADNDSNIDDGSDSMDYNDFMNDTTEAPQTETDSSDTGLITEDPTDIDYSYDDTNTSYDGSGREEESGLIDDNYDDAEGGAMGEARRKRYSNRGPSIIAESSTASAKQFQSEVQEILREDETFEQKFVEALALFKANNDGREKVQPLPRETNELTAAHKRRLKLEGAKDVFGQPIQYEYHESLDPYQNIPKSR